jgi:hypothetical protein
MQVPAVGASSHTVVGVEGGEEWWKICIDGLNLELYPPDQMGA